MPPADYTAQLQSPDKTTVLYAMLHMVEHADNPTWIAEQLPQLTEHPDPEISGLAITYFGHLARIHGTVMAGNAAQMQAYRTKWRPKPARNLIL